MVRKLPSDPHFLYGHSIILGERCSSDVKLPNSFDITGITLTKALRHPVGYGIQAEEERERKPHH